MRIIFLFLLSVCVVPAGIGERCEGRPCIDIPGVLCLYDLPQQHWVCIDTRPIEWK